ncbi:MAG: hypothetical protein AB2803_16460 [Candidatus Thiodiazotropha sp.]
MDYKKWILSFIKGGGVFLRSILSILSSSREDNCDDDGRLHDVDMIGEYNHRTGQLDAGTDPNGWYEEDM